MKKHSFLPIYLTLCLLLSGCSAKPLITSSPTIVPSPTMKPSTVFSSSNVDHIVEQSKLGEGQIMAGDFSPDGKRFGAITPLGIYIYDIKTLKKEQFIAGDLPLRAAAFSPDWSLIALGTGSTVTLWQLADNEVLAHLETQQGQVTRLLFSPDGSLLVSLVQPPGEEVYTKKVQIQSVAFSPDGSLLASSSMESVKLWQFKDGLLLQSFSVAGGWVSTVRFSLDGKYLAATSAEGKVEIWQVADRQHIAELPVPELGGDKDMIAFAPDSDFLAIGEMSQIGLWHLIEDKPFQTLPIRDAKVITLRFSPDGSLLVCGLTNGMIQLWQLPEGKLLRTLRGGNDGIASLDFSADGQTLLSASRDGTIRIWKISKGEGSLLPNQI